MPSTLFVVDDSATMRKVFELTFAGEDITVVTHDGSDGVLGRIREVRPQAAIIDVSLQGANSYDLVRNVKSDAGVATFPIYLLYSDHSPLDENAARACGASGAIAKPFETQTMIDRVKQVLTTVVAKSSVSSPTGNATAPFGNPAAPAAAVAAAMSSRGEAPPPSAGRPAPMPVGAPAPRPAPLAAAPAPSPAATPARPVGMAAPPAGTGPLTGSRPGIAPGGGTAKTATMMGPSPFAARAPAPQAPPMQPTPQPSAPQPPTPAVHVPLPAQMPPLPAASAPLPNVPTSSGAQITIEEEELHIEGGLGEEAFELPGPAPVVAPVAPARPVERPAPATVAAAPRPVEKPAPVMEKPLPVVIPPTERTTPFIALPPEEKAAPVIEKPVEKPAEKPAEKRVEKPATDGAHSPDIVRQVARQVEPKLADLGLTPAQVEAVTALTREVVERVVWEVVPQLAEVMIREELKRLTEE